MRRFTTTIAMTAVLQAACGGASSPLGSTAMARDHVEPPGVLVVNEAAASRVDCTPAVSPGRSSQSARAGAETKWTIAVTFDNAPPERRDECSWHLESADRDMVFTDPSTGVRSDATSERHGDGQVPVAIAAQTRPEGAIAMPRLRMLRLHVAGLDQPVLWNFTWYRWTQR
jgi:hypothetical protein